jgi:hypothetical protein
MNPRPSLQIRIKAKPHECQFIICYCPVFLRYNTFVSMVRCKNAGGAPSDGDESPPRRIEIARGKRVKIAAKKRKRTLTEAEVAQAVADAAEAAERGGRSSGIRIGESRFHLEGRQLGTEATEETVDAPVEQPTEDPEETEEQTVHSPQCRRSGRT